jgi:hypothetical protein
LASRSGQAAVGTLLEIREVLEQLQCIGSKVLFLEQTRLEW